MRTSTVRIPEDKRDKLKILASTEKREMKDILSDLIDEYLERHKETLELLSNPEWVEIIEAGKAEIRRISRGSRLPFVKNSLLMAGRAEVAALAGKRQQIFTPAVFAAHTGKRIMKITAIQITQDYLTHIGTKKSILFVIDNKWVLMVA